MALTWDHAVVAAVVLAAVIRLYRMLRRNAAARGCGACPAVKKP